MKTALRDHLTLVYAMGYDEDGPIKIGMTSQILERVRYLQVAAPYPVRVYGVRFASMLSGRAGGSIKACFANGARALEARTHRKLRECDVHLQGEWFDICAADALAAIDKVGSTDGPRCIGLSGLAGADLSGRADREMTKMHKRIMHEAVTVNSFIQSVNEA